MYISKKNKELIKNKFSGRCAYSGSILEPDWHMDHVKPLRRNFGEPPLNPENDVVSNFFPAQRMINIYKGSLKLEDFRRLLSGMNERLKLLPKNPYTEKGIKHKKYMLKLAGYFGITEDQPFKGKFYFENNNCLIFPDSSKKQTMNMEKMKKAVIIMSKTFPATHSKKGQATNFRGHLLFKKIHTIRGNYDWWAKKEKMINEGKMYLSIREWSGKPYDSKQVELCRLFRIGVQKVSLTYGVDDAEPEIKIDNKVVPIEEVAKNDALSVDDFSEFFLSKENTFEGACVHFTSFRY